MAKRERTNKQIIDQTNALARECYRSMGYAVRKGYRFDRATHPQELGLWEQACIAQRILTGTDPNDCLAEEEEDEASPDAAPPAGR